jgi:hypothetical protein
MMKGEFPMNTKQKLTEMYTKIMLKKFWPGIGKTCNNTDL